MTGRQRPYPGAFITLEGGEGVGKSTQERLLAEHLSTHGVPVVRTREPGGTPVAEEIRHVLLTPREMGMDPHAEALLFAAARADHVARVIRPALLRGEIVVCDRYLDSSVAYQGFGRELGVDRIRELSMWATGGLAPDLVIILDLDPAVGLARLSSTDRLEREPLAYHERVRAGFRAIAEADPQRYLVVDASLPPSEVAQVVRSRVAELLEHLGVGHARA